MMLAIVQTPTQMLVLLRDREVGKEAYGICLKFLNTNEGSAKDVVR